MSDTITVQTIDGPREVPVAYRGGFFALHESLDRYCGKYTVTHIPTGRYVGDVPTLATGRAMIRVLRADAGIDWDFTDLNRAGREAQYERVLIARRAVRG